MAYSLDVFKPALADGGLGHQSSQEVTPHPGTDARVPVDPLPARRVLAAPFIKGPLPLHWMVTAMGLSRRAAKLAVALWYRLGLTQRKPVVGTQEGLGRVVRIDRKLRSACAVKRWEVGPGIKDLERAGLVRILKSGRGRCPVVEVVVPPSAQQAAAS